MPVRLRFDDFELDPQGFRLLRAGVEVGIERRPLELLCYVAMQPGRLIRKRELREKVWQAESLSESVLSNTVAKLRKALGQAADARFPLETVRGVGYRWHAEQPADPELPAAPPKAGAPLLIAREAQRRQLVAALDAAASGRGQLLLIEGEAGIGKTALLNELELLASERGYSVWRGAGYDGGSAPAYWPWVEILRAARAERSAREWQRLLPERCSALASVPELCAVAGSSGSEASPALRFQLFDELTRLLRSLAVESPRLLVIDDVHWADAATIELLSYAARVLGRSPLLLAVAAREVDGAWEADEAKLSAFRSLQRRASILQLQGLSAVEVGQLLGVLAEDCRGDAALARVFAERTRGNPLFVRHLLEWLRQRDALSEARVLQLTAAELPPAIRSVIEQRLAAVPDTTRCALGAASAAGLEIDVQLLAELLERPLAEVLDALEPALQLQIIERAPQASSVRFTHCLVRDTLYAALPAAASGALHARLARTLARRGAVGDARQLATIAHHSLLALPSELELSVQHSLRAAAAARTSTGFEAAVSIMSRIVQQHESASEDLRERCELLILLGRDQKCMGQIRAAWHTIKRGAELALQLGDAELVSRFARELTPWLEFGGADESFVWLIMEQAQRLAAQASPAIRARLLAWRAQLDIDQPLPEREAWLAEAEALAAQQALQARPGAASGDSAVELERQVSYARATMRSLLRRGESERAIERYRELERRSRKKVFHAGRSAETFTIERTAYSNALIDCDLARAAAAYARCRELAHGAHITGMDFAVELMTAGRALAAGDLDELACSIQRLRAAASGGGGFDLAWLRYLGLLAYEQGTFKSQVAAEAPWPALSGLPRHARVAGYIFQAWAFAQCELTREAQSTLAALDARVVSSMPLSREDLGPLCLLAEACCLVDDRAGAERAYVQLQPFAALNALGPTYEYLGSVAHYLGLCAVLLGRKREARAHLERAATVNAELEMPLQLARTRLACERL